MADDEPIIPELGDNGDQQASHVAESPLVAASRTNFMDSKKKRPTAANIIIVPEGKKIMIGGEEFDVASEEPAGKKIMIGGEEFDVAAEEPEAVPEPPK